MTSKENDKLDPKCGTSLDCFSEANEVSYPPGTNTSYKLFHGSPVDFVMLPKKDYQQIQEDKEINLYVKKLYSSIKDLYVTKILIIINISIFLYMGSRGVDLLTPSNTNIHFWGGNISSSTMFGEPWRLFTCMFIHGGIIHLVMNMCFFAILGAFVEKLFGHLNYLLIYLFSGLMGSMISLLFHPIGISVGASGALFGIFGGLIGYLIVCKKSIPKRIYNSIKKSVIITLFINLVFGFSVPNIDMAAHLGGLAAGVFASIILSTNLSASGIKSRTRKGIIFTILAMFILSGTYSTIKTKFKVPISYTFGNMFEVIHLCYKYEPYSVLLLNKKKMDSSRFSKNYLLEFWQSMHKKWEHLRLVLQKQMPFGEKQEIPPHIENLFKLQEEKILIFSNALSNEKNWHNQRLNEINKKLDSYIKN